MRYKKNYCVYDATDDLYFVNQSEVADYLKVSRMAVSLALKKDGKCKGHSLEIRRNCTGKPYNLRSFF